MSSINKTPHYNLSQFGDSPDDKPSWRGDYTGDMSKIDSQMYRNATDATTATSVANTAKSAADSALALAKTNESNISEQGSYFNALGVTSQQTAQSLMSSINAKAENSALTTLQGTVSALSGAVDTKADATEVYTRSQADARYTQQGGYAGTAQQIVRLVDGKADSSVVYTRQQADERFVLNDSVQNILVAIGDSYFEGYRTTKPATDSMIVVASEMLGLTCRNFAVGGSGFITGSSTFSNQLDAANAQIADKTQVKYVVIGGGRNDAWNTLTETDVKSTLEKAVTLFPYSKIVFIPMMWDNMWPTWQQGIAYGKMVAGGREVPQVSVIYDAPTWGLFRKDGMTDIHPNTIGSRTYAQYIASACANGRSKRSETFKMNTSGFTGDAEVVIDGLNVSINGRGNKTKWDQSDFATISGAGTFGAWSAFVGWTDSGDFLRIKFTGSALSVIDMITGAGGAGNISFSNTISVFGHN
nr:MAG TPA: hypothetical protein [Caudoviricetes sp.]